MTAFAQRYNRGTDGSHTASAVRDGPRLGGQTADIKRVSVQQAHAKTDTKQALLVCAFEDEAKCRMLNLEGSIYFTSSHQ